MNQVYFLVQVVFEWFRAIPLFYCFIVRIMIYQNYVHCNYLFENLIFYQSVNPNNIMSL